MARLALGIGKASHRPLFLLATTGTAPANWLPVIICAEMAIEIDLAEALAALAARLGSPILAEPLSNLRFASYPVRRNLQNYLATILAG